MFFCFRDPFCGWVMVQRLVAHFGGKLDAQISGFAHQRFGAKFLCIKRLVWSTFWSRAPFCGLGNARAMLQWPAQ